MAFQISVQAEVGKKYAPMLRAKLRAAHRLIPRCALQELSVAIVSDARMAKLHHRYLKINSPTDVLTFELDHDARGRVTAGEVIVCLPQAKRQAKVGTDREVLLCALHGMLHLCGFDDKNDRQFAAMHRAEDRLLSRLGIGPVFNPRGRSERQR